MNYLLTRIHNYSKIYLVSSKANEKRTFFSLDQAQQFAYLQYIKHLQENNNNLETIKNFARINHQYGLESFIYSFIRNAFSNNRDQALKILRERHLNHAHGKIFERDLREHLDPNFDLGDSFDSLYDYMQFFLHLHYLSKYEEKDYLQMEIEILVHIIQDLPSIEEKLKALDIINGYHYTIQEIPFPT